MVRIFSTDHFNAGKAAYVFDPRGGKHHRGAFVPQQKASFPRLYPAIVLAYEPAEETFPAEFKNMRGFTLRVTVAGKEICKPKAGVIADCGPNEEYEEKVKEMIDVAKEYHRRIWVRHDDSSPTSIG